MSQDNLAVVRKLYERRPDLADSASATAVAMEFFDPAIHIDMTRRVFNPASYVGYEGALAALSELREIWERFVLRAERFIEVDDEVLVIEISQGRGRGSSVEVQNRLATLYTLRNDRIVRMVVYENPSEALEAVGLRE